MSGTIVEALVTEHGTVGDPMVRWDPSTINCDNVCTLMIDVAVDRPNGPVPARGATPILATRDLLFGMTR